MYSNKSAWPNLPFISEERSLSQNLSVERNVCFINCTLGNGGEKAAKAKWSLSKDETKRLWKASPSYSHKQKWQRLSKWLKAIVRRWASGCVFYISVCNNTVCAIRYVPSCYIAWQTSYSYLVSYFVNNSWNNKIILQLPSFYRSNKPNVCF